MSAETLRRAAEQIREDCPIPVRSRGFDFIDYPTGWTIQRAGVQHLDEACSAVQTNGALLCDCGALYPLWRRCKALLAVADWLDTAYEDWHYSEHSLSAMSVRAMSGQPNHPDTNALAVARAYLGESS